MITIKDNLAEFSQALRQYADVSGRDHREVIASRASRFGFNLSKELRALKPEKGEIRKEVEAVLQSGRKIRVRPKAIAFARNRTIATATRISDRRGSQYMEVNSKGKLKSGGMNFMQLAVARETAIRSSGRGILSHATKFKGLPQRLKSDNFSAQPVATVNRYSRQVGRAVFDGSRDGASLVFTWGGSAASESIAEGLLDPQQVEAVKRALNATRADMLQYIARKRAGRKGVTK